MRLFRGGGLPSAHGAFEERTGVLLLSARALCFYTDTGPTGGAAAGGIGTHSAAAVAIAACAGTGGGGDAALLPGPLEVKVRQQTQQVLPTVMHYQGERARNAQDARAVRSSSTLKGVQLMR